MGHAYTPGLTVTGRTVLRKKRLLPLPGSVLVGEGQAVESGMVVARTDLPGKVHVVNVVNQLSILPSDLRDYMLKKEGDQVKKGEAIAEDKPFLSWFKTHVSSPIDGTVESISDVTGQVLIREHSQPLDVLAYVDGRADEIFPEQGVTIETTCAFIQGIFGVGGEAWGPLVRAVDTPEAPLLPEQLEDSMRGAVVFGGAYAGWDVLQAAKRIGVDGLVVGGIGAQDLKTLLGYDLGVAITGTERIGFTLIVTEGFGSIPMAGKTFDLLSQHVGRKACISGATQIRAGVIRPEIIIPHPAGSSSEPSRTAKAQEGIAIGNPVRIIREPYFGRIGRVTALPADLRIIPTESRVRVLEVELPDHSRVTVPRANVEIIEG